ncbi:MAG: ABC transporter substrate-binding protein [Desulfobacteraceae bacterium]|nr:ABC transporter substrate-binding protein [Desulfobacteraceae bacterium]
MKHRSHIVSLLAVLGILCCLLTPAAAAEGKRLTFTLDTPPYRQLEAQAIAEQLKSLGIQVEARVWEKVVLRDQVKTGERLAYLTDWGSAYFDPFDLGEPKLTTGGRGNFSFYANPLVDEALRTGSSITDPAERQKAYSLVQKTIFNDAPWIFGYVLTNIEAASAKVDGFAPAMDNRINLHDVGFGGGETLVVGMNVNAFVSLDPAMFRDRESETVVRNMFDGLVTRTREAEVVPELAESWTQEDEQTYLFTLRQGPTFHNGDPMTVDDVIFTFDRVLKEGAIGGQSSPRKGLLGPLEREEKAGERQVRFILTNPFPVFLQALVHFQIVPQKYIEAVGDAKFADQPVGAGPFKFVSGKLDNEVVMERFDGYYGGAPDLPPVGPARIKRAVFRVMPEPSTRVAALLAGEVAIIQAIPTDLVDQLSSTPSVKVYTVEGTRSYQIELNTAKAPFDDVRVRQAVNYGVDWQDILENIYRGYGVRLATCFLPSGFGYDPAVQPYPYDPQKAKALLREAGYTTD